MFRIFLILTACSSRHQCGAQEYRRRRAAGETPFPPSPTLPNAFEFTVPSVRNSHMIPCRLFEPQDSTVTPKGVLYHIHGGGWVIGSAAGCVRSACLRFMKSPDSIWCSQDLLLNALANEIQLIVVSVEYRLAPEHPFPAASEDCYDVVDWLQANAISKVCAP